MATPPEPSYEFIAGRVSSSIFVNYPARYPDSYPFLIRYELRLSEARSSKWEVYRDFGFHSDTAVHLYLSGYDPDRIYRYQLRACWDVPHRGSITPGFSPSNWCSDWTDTRYIEPVTFGRITTRPIWDRPGGLD